ncbi:MAG: hypothetical protein DHS20C02_04890 [Micavibrio sp.]|nr:MAG: hypothetical protein DHS20C02_04890 [Micavibrio sp.]
MSPVKSALQKLEGSVTGLERALKIQGGEQPDMFAQASSGPSNENATMQEAAAPQKNVNAAIVGEKIDSAIDKVEALLRAGGSTA